MNPLKRFWEEEDGQAFSEYGLLIALIAIILVGVLALFGKDLLAWFENMRKQLIGNQSCDYNGDGKVGKVLRDAAGTLTCDGD